MANPILAPWARSTRWLTPALLAVVLVGALALRIPAALRNEWPTVDGTYYMEQARQLVTTGRLPYSCFPPGYPALIALPLALHGVTGPMALLRAAQTANVACGTLLVLLGFLVMRPYLGRWWALAGATILALLPIDIIMSKSDVSETSYACGLLGAWLAYRRGWRLAAGLLFGITYLIRPEGLIAGVGLLAHDAVKDRRLDWRLLLGLAIPVVPFLIYVRLAGGHWGLSSKDIALVQSVQAYPGWSYLHLIGGNALALLPVLAGVLGLPLVLLAAVGIVTRPGRWLWLLAPLLPVPFVTNVMGVRFWHPYLAVLLLAAGLGLQAIVARAGRRRWLPIATITVALGGLALAARDDVLYVKIDGEAFYGLREAGLWLHDQVDRDTIIAAYKPYTAFWADCRFIKIPDTGSAREIVIWARHHGAHYLIVNVHVVHTVAHGLDPLLQSPLPPDLEGEVTLVRLFQYDPVKQTTAVYRIEQPQPTSR